ncbi:MAG: hypothetical protein LBD04_06650 [Synergistaceae bacterium]|jgi:hypothetical protein|nr:hypothetical protein [Synergistaceae bacterium]
MGKTFNADDFALCAFIWEGREYRFRPASIRDLIDYYEGELFPKIRKAQEEIDPYKVLSLQKEAIRRHIPELTDEIIDSMPQKAAQGLFAFIQNGNTPDELEKNF